MAKRVVIETEDCIGCESCEELCSEVFAFNFDSIQILCVSWKFGLIVRNFRLYPRPVFGGVRSERA